LIIAAAQDEIYIGLWSRLVVIHVLDGNSHLQHLYGRQRSADHYLYATAAAIYNYPVLTQ
jgi:hypothetical protein